MLEQIKHEQGQFTKEEIVANLTEAIEIQKLHTELQELRARMFLAKAQETHAMIQMNQMMAKEDEGEVSEEEAIQIRKDFEKGKTEVKVPESKI